ncbi:MAG: thioredoxin family protein [Gemmatimonas sp.]
MTFPMRLLLTVVFLASLPATGSASTARGRCEVVNDSTLLKLQASGQTFADFLAAAKARREGWLQMSDSARVDESLLARARAVGGTWHLLVIAVDRCGDSMNSVPYLAKLAELVPGLDLRIVLPDQGRAVQETHRSLDGRVATPTIVLLDGSGRDAGCIVELPREIRDWAHGVRSMVSSDSLHAGIRVFYARDRGKGITTEAVEMLEAAKAGGVHCKSGTAK